MQSLRLSSMHRVLILVLCLLFIHSASVQSQLSNTQLDSLRELGDRQGWTFTTGRTSATDRPVEVLCGYVAPQGPSEPFGTEVLTESAIIPPPQFDWRDSGACPPIRDQGACGSCWAFGAIGAVEPAIKIVDGIEVDLSEQWLLSCTMNEGGCWGGGATYPYMYKWADNCGDTGAVLEADFPYEASSLPCECSYPSPRYRIVTRGQVPEVVMSTKVAIMTYGPVETSVCVDNAFRAYDEGVFNACSDEINNHAVVLVGWNDSLGESGVWILRNSWGEDWGMDGYMLIEYNCSRVGTLPNYVVYRGLPEVQFTYPGGVPQQIDPYYEVSFEIVVTSLKGDPSPGTGQLHYTINGTTVQSVPLAELADDHYLATLPEVSCGDRLEYYFSAEASSGERYFDPPLEKPSFRTVTVHQSSVVFEDDFETDMGWTVTGDAARGDWERGVPVIFDPDGWGYPPPSDYDGSGTCYLTENSDSTSNVTNGTTSLISPLLELTSGDAVIRYARWFSNDYKTGRAEEVFRTFVSNDDGGTWVLMEEVGPDLESSGCWYEKWFVASDYIIPTSTVRLRFDASQVSSYFAPVEAAIDAVRILGFDCADCGDVNMDGMVTLSDITRLIDFLYVSRAPLTIPEAGNVNASPDGILTLSDVTRLIDHVFISRGDLDCSID